MFKLAGREDVMNGMSRRRLVLFCCRSAAIVAAAAPFWVAPTVMCCRSSDDKAAYDTSASEVAVYARPICVLAQEDDCQSDVGLINLLGWLLLLIQAALLNGCALPEMQGLSHACRLPDQVLLRLSSS